MLVGDAAGNAAVCVVGTMMFMAKIADDEVLAFQQARGRDRDRCGVIIFDRYDRVVEAIIRDDAAKAGVHLATLEEKQELRDELRVCVFEAAVSYDPDKTRGEGGFDYWVRYCIQKRLASLAGGAHDVDMPESWLRVGRIAAKVDETLRQTLQRGPTIHELRAGVLEHCKTWARQRVIESPRWNGSEDIERAVHKKLSKQGTLNAIEHLEDILNLKGSMHPLDIDRDVLDESDGTGGGLCSALGGMWNSVEQRIIACRTGEVDGDEWTFEQIGDDVNLPWTEVRRIYTLAVAKPRAPHAHFVYLSGIDNHVDWVEDVNESGDAVQRLRYRTPVLAR